MNLYLISQVAMQGYDTYDSAVVCAESEEEAKNMHPGSGSIAIWNEERQKYITSTGFVCWGYDWSNPEDVKVTLIGVAVEGAVKEVVCASFNAG